MYIYMYIYEYISSPAAILSRLLNKDNRETAIRDWVILYEYVYIGVCVSFCVHIKYIKIDIDR